MFIGRQGVIGVRNSNTHIKSLVKITLQTEFVNKIPLTDFFYSHLYLLIHLFQRTSVTSEQIIQCHTINVKVLIYFGTKVRLFTRRYTLFIRRS